MGVFGSFFEYMRSIIDALVAFINANNAWAAPIAFLVALGESLAFLSLIIPGTAVLVAASFLIAKSNVSFLAVWLAAGLGGSIGYALSYWIGWYFKDDIHKVWPFTKNPELLPRGHAFFEKWGAIGVFFGHFFGPVRAVIPVVAGIVQMPHLMFQLANVTSAFLWAFGVIAPGALGIRWLQGWFG